MPVYSYRCTNCSDIFDETMSFKEYAVQPDRKRCPFCKKLMIPSRIIHPPLVLWKSDGFYITDNRKKDDEPS
jgi:putative FmdB family regulatory protein